MNSEESSIIPSNIVMEEYIKPAIHYYEKTIHKIAPYFFCDTLIKMVGFQQLIISRAYQIKRNDARSKKGIDYIRECVSQIQEPFDLIRLMDNWYAFDLCMTAPSFVNPVLAANIRKSYCKIGDNYFDCHNCKKIACKQNLIWNKSTIVFDFDSNVEDLESNYFLIKNALEVLNLEYSIKLSSLGGYHINIGLPENAGSTIFDRNLYQFCLFKELREKGINIDDNSLDPVPIIRAPFSLHYKRLTPSLCINDDTVLLAIKYLKEIETLPLEERIEKSLNISKKWNLDWKVNNTEDESFNRIIKKWKEGARKAIFRERESNGKKKTNVGDYLRKGKLMTMEDEELAFNLLLKEGKPKELAKSIIELNKKKEPKRKKKGKSVIEEILLEFQKDIPKNVLEIPPPTIFLIIDNATVDEIQEITGVRPLKVKAQCLNTDEGMKLLFKDSKLLRNYPRRWNCKSIYIGGLYSSYNYCGAADLVIAVKTKNIWDRDIKILNEMSKVLNEGDGNLIVAHLLGLDFCKDNNISTQGALLIFKRLIKSILSTDFNIIITSDHSGEDYIPYFEIITCRRKENL